MNRIIIFGDSITWGAWDSKGGWPTRLKEYVYSQALESEYEKYDEVYHLGISGDDTSLLLKRFETELVARLDKNRKQIVIFAIGTNDSMYEIISKNNQVNIELFSKNLNKLIKVCNKHHITDIVFVGLTPVDDELMNVMPWMPTHGYSTEQILKYDQCLRTIVDENSIHYIDFYDRFSRSPEKLLSDGLHPNTKGHDLIHTTILTKLKQFGYLH